MDVEQPSLSLPGVEKHSETGSVSGMSVNSDAGTNYGAWGVSGYQGGYGNEAFPADTQAPGSYSQSAGKTWLNQAY